MKKELLKEKLKLKEVRIDDERSFINICCPSCSSDIPAANININDKIAKCDSCAAVFPFQKDLDIFSKTEPKAVPHTLRPEGIDVFNFKDRHEISVTQPMADLEMITLFIFSTFLVVTFLIYMKSGLPLIYVLGSGFALLAYSFSFINKDKHKVYIDIDKEALRVKWRPKKMNSDKSYDAKDVKQLYVKGQRLFMIVDGVEGSKHIDLIPNLTDITKIHFLEQEIERYLGIEDKAIVGEDR